MWSDNAGGWAIFTPADGWSAWLLDEGKLYRHNGAAWVVDYSFLLSTGGELTGDLVVKSGLFSSVRVQSTDVNGSPRFICEDNLGVNRAVFFFDDGNGSVALVRSDSSGVMETILTLADDGNVSVNGAAPIAINHLTRKDWVEAYVDGRVASRVVYKGGYNAATNAPNLDASPAGILTGFMYTITAAGNFFTTAVEIGDVLICEVDDPTVVGDWTIVNKDLNAASIKASYESNADTNAFSDAEQSKLAISASEAYVDAKNYPAGGRLSATGVLTAGSPGVSASKVATGHYRVTHNFGNADYTATVSTIASIEVIATIDNIQINTFDIHVDLALTPIDAQTSFVMVGW